MIELMHNPRIISLAQQVLKLLQHILILSRIKARFRRVLKLLQLEKQVVKIFQSRHFIDFNCQQGFDCLVALSKLAHCAVMNWVPLHLVLDSKDLPVPVQDILGVLLEEIEYPDVKLFVSFDAVRVVEDSSRQMPMVDVHVLKPVFVFFSQQLIVQGFLEINAFDVQEHDQGLIVTFEAKTMISVAGLVVDVNLLVNVVLRRAYFCQKVQSNVFEAKETGDVEWSAA